VSKPRILLVFNRISDFKKVIYDSFVNTLNDEATVDLFIQRHDSEGFHNLINNNICKYDYFVILLQYNGVNEDTLAILKKIPPQKLILIDKKTDLLSGNFSCIYQDYQDDIFNALQQLSKNLQHYSKLYLVYPPDNYYPQEVKEGLLAYCRQQTEICCAIVEDVSSVLVQKGTAFLLMSEVHLAKSVKICLNKNLKIGSEVGLVSYNDQPYKELLSDGITVLTTDFALMGQKAAQIILTHQQEHFRLPFNVLLRQSL
jgi:DNA-binding LacI/PurR family transcriptional regulator